MRIVIVIVENIVGSHMSRGIVYHAVQMTLLMYITSVSNDSGTGSIIAEMLIPPFLNHGKRATDNFGLI